MPEGGVRDAGALGHGQVAEGRTQLGQLTQTYRDKHNCSISTCMPFILYICTSTLTFLNSTLNPLAKNKDESN